MTVIHFYGASGSGTSSLGRRLAEKLGFFFMDTDDYYWKPIEPAYTQSRTKEERLALIRADFEKHKNCVLSGALCGWGDALIDDFTLAVRVVTPTDERIRRLKEREHRKFGERIDEGGDRYESHLEFLQWAARYDEGDLSIRSKMEHDLWEQKLPCKKLTVDGTLSFEENVEKILKELAE